MRPIDHARFIARLAHKGQLYGNEPYIHHVSRVVSRVRLDPAATFGDIVLAYLHDVVEDTDVTFEELEDLGFYTDGLRLITRQHGQTYRDYITGLKHHDSARRVKIADLRENLAHNPKTPSHRERYVAALDELEDY